MGRRPPGGQLGCLRAEIVATPGQDPCPNGSRRIIQVQRVRVNPLTRDEAREHNTEASLFAACEIIEIDRQINGEQVPEHLQRNFSLKGICKRRIIEHLLELDPHTHLFDRVSMLGLPTSLTSYLLYDTSLDDVDQYMDGGDHFVDNDDDANSNRSLDVAVGSDIDDCSGGGKDCAIDSDDDVTFDFANGEGEDIGIDSEDNDDNGNNDSSDVLVGNVVDDYSSRDCHDVFVESNGDDYNHDCSLDVAVGSDVGDYSISDHDAFYDSDNDDDHDYDDYSLAVAIGSDDEDGSQDIVGGSDDGDYSSDGNQDGDTSDEDDDDDYHDDNNSDGNLNVIDSDSYDSGNGSSLVIVSCDDEDDDHSNDCGLATVNSDGYGSDDGGRLAIVNSDDDDEYSNGGSLDVVIDSDDNRDDGNNLDDDDDDDYSNSGSLDTIIDSDDNGNLDHDDDDCSLVVVIDSDNDNDIDNDIGNVDSLDTISNDDSTDPHTDYLSFDVPLKHLEYLDLRIKELDPHTHLFNRVSRL